MKRFHKLTAALLLALALAPSLARADVAPSPKPPLAADAKKGEWQDAELGPMMGRGESYQSTTMVTTAYTFIWLMVLGFVASVWLRSQQVERELAELAQRIGRSAPPVDGAIKKG
jgi:hypothetical protein